MPNTIDASFIDSLPPNVAVQFLERVAKSAAARGVPLPRGRRLEVRHLEAGRRATSAGSPPACSRWACSPSSASGSRPAPATSGSSPTSAIMCAGAATTTVYPSTNEEDTAYILSDSECQVVFAEDDAQIAKLTARKAELPAVHKVVTFDGAADGDWVISLDELEKLGERLPRRAPGRHRGDRQGASAATSWPP